MSLFAVFALVLWFVALPAYVGGLIEDRITRRLPGSIVEVDSVRLGLGATTASFTLRAEGTRVRDLQVELEGAPWSLARGWRRASALTLGPGRVDLDAPALATWRERLSNPRLQAQGPPARAATGTTWPSLALSGVDVRLAGQDIGELSLLGLAGALRHGEPAKLRARTVRLADTSRSLEVEALELELTRGPPGWSLRRVAAGSCSVVLGEAPREGWQALLSALDPRQVPDDTHEVVEAPREDAVAAGDDPSALPDLLSPVYDGPFEGTLGALIVRPAEGEAPLLEGLHATVNVSAGRLNTRALGRLSGGTLEWDLRVEAGERRGEGRLHVDALPLSLVEPFLPDVPLHRPESARFSADVRVDRARDGLLTLEGTLGLRGAALSDPAIGPVPVRDLDVAWRGTASWSPERRRLEVDDSTLTVRDVETRWRAEVELGDDRWSTRVRATLPPTRCNDAVAAIPEDLLQDAAGFRWTGRIGGQLRFAARSDELEATRLDVDVANGCLFESVPAFADLRRLQGPFVHRVREPDGRLFEMSAGPGTANWAPLHATSPFFVHAVLGHEDAAFLRHEGFSVGSIRDALVRNLETGAYRRGGSTITMQLAKNVFLHREKTLARKAQEVLLTWWLETALPKEELLALYLNVIEYGPGIYGIMRAAEHYFGRHPSELTVAESAYLACILPDPKGFHAQWQSGRPPERMRRRVARFLRVLHERGRIDDVALADGLAQLNELRFHRVGQSPSAWPQSGRARALPFATAVVGDPFEAFLAPEGPEPAPPEASPLEQL